MYFFYKIFNSASTIHTKYVKSYIMYFDIHKWRISWILNCINTQSCIKTIFDRCNWGVILLIGIRIVYKLLSIVLSLKIPEPINRRVCRKIQVYVFRVFNYTHNTSSFFSVCAHFRILWHQHSGSYSHNKIVTGCLSVCLSLRISLTTKLIWFSFTVKLLIGPGKVHYHFGWRYQ